MNKWPRNELESAFEHYLAHTRDCAGSGNWSRWADLFTEDVAYCSNGVPAWNNREDVRAGVIDYYSQYPFNHVVDFSLNWRVIDETTGRAVFSLQVIMEDLGDGSDFREDVLIHMIYAGNQQWKREEDYFSTELFTRMAENWVKIKESLE